MVKKYNLSKQELGQLTKIISLASMQEEILDAIKVKYRLVVTTSVFKRLGLDIKLFPNCAVNLTTGELQIKDEKPKRNKNRDIQAKG